MNKTIDTIQPEIKKPIAYYDTIKRNLFDFEDIRLTHKINSLNNKDLYQIEFYIDKTSTDYTMSLITSEPQEEFEKIKNILRKANSSYNYLYNILTHEQHNQFEKFFNKFKYDKLDGTYWKCGSGDGDCGEYILFWEEMFENMKESNTEEPNDDKKAFMELLDKVWDICKARAIDRLLLSF